MKATALLWGGVVLLSAFLAGLILGRREAALSSVTVRTDTVTVVRVDTLRIVEPQPVRVTEIRRDTIRTLVKGDTVYVPVPIRRYEFSDTTFRAVLTGYDIRAESFEVYPRTVTRYIETEKVRTIVSDRRWGFGISVGYGITREGFSPYIGIGLQYRLFRW